MIESKEQAQLLNEVKNLQKFIAEDDYINCATSFGKLVKLIQRSEISLGLLADLNVLSQFIEEKSGERRNPLDKHVNERLKSFCFLLSYTGVFKDAPSIRGCVFHL